MENEDDGAGSNTEYAASPCARERYFGKLSFAQFACNRA